jgi:hypothetical protein
MTNLPPNFQEKIKDWYPVFGNKTIRCKKFNRRKCWEKSDFQKWLGALGKGHVINPLIYVHIESCVNSCLSEGKLDDVKYFKNYKKQGYDYITIEGGNRHDSTEKIYEVTPEFHNKKINISVVEGIDREEMHDLYLNLAGGRAPNEQEKRTGIYGKVSDVVRKVSEELIFMWEKVNSITRPRMKDDEMVAMIMNYVTNNSFGTHPLTGKTGSETLDSLYETNEYNSKLFNYVTDSLKAFWEKVREEEIITKKQPKVIIYLLTILYSHFKDRYKISNDRKFIDEFFDYFNNIYHYDYEIKKGKKTTKTRVRLTLGKKYYTYKDLLGNMLTNLSVLNEVEYLVKSELIPKLETTGVIKPINNEEFTFKHRKEYIGLHKFEKNSSIYVKVRTNNPELDWFPGQPEFMNISLTEAFLNKYELDHIIPKSKNGPTTIENAELTSKEYNRKKYNNEVNK